MILIKNAQVYSPAPLGQKDVLVSFDRILQIADHIDTPYTDTRQRNLYLYYGIKIRNDSSSTKTEK